MIFNDKSGSMSGQPFAQLKEACLGISETIYHGNNGEKSFESTTVCFYGSDAKEYYKLNDLESYNRTIEKSSVGGMTNFSACFDLIYRTMNDAKDGDKFSILFFTDGNDTCSRNVHNSVNELKNKLQEGGQYSKRAIES